MYYGKNKMKHFCLISLICILGFPFTTIHAKAYNEKDVYTAYEKLINNEHNEDEKYNKSHDYNTQSTYYSIVNIDSAGAPELVINKRDSISYIGGMTKVYSYKNGKAYLVCKDDDEVSHSLYKGNNCIYSVQGTDTMGIPQMYDRISLDKGLEESYISYDKYYFDYDKTGELVPLSASQIKEYEKINGGPSSGNRLYGKAANYKDVYKAITKFKTKIVMDNVDSKNNLKKAFGMTVELGNTTNNYLSRDGGPFSCSDGTYLFIAGQDGIYKTNIKTHKTEKIVSVNQSNGIYCISKRGDYIYYVWDKAYGSDELDAYIYRVKKDGTNKKELLKGNGTYIVGDIMYYYDYDNNQECKLNLNTLESQAVEVGKAILTVSSSSVYRKNDYVTQEPYYKVTDIIVSGYDAIYDNYFYYVGNTGKDSYYIYRQKSTGKDKSKVVDKMSSTAFSIYDGYLYYINNNNLYRINLKTQKTSAVCKIEKNVSNISVYKNCIYYSVWVENTLKIEEYIMNLDGTMKKKIAERYIS